MTGSFYLGNIGEWHMRFYQKTSAHQSILMKTMKTSQMTKRDARCKGWPFLSKIRRLDLSKRSRFIGVASFRKSKFTFHCSLCRLCSSSMYKFSRNNASFTLYLVTNFKMYLKVLFHKNTMDIFVELHFMKYLQAEVYDAVQSVCLYALCYNS